MIKKIIYTLLSTFISVDIVYANVCLNYFRNNGKSLATTKIFSSKKAISKSVIIDWSTGELKLSGEQPLTDSLKKNQVLINNAIIERDSIGNAKKVSWFSHAQNGYGGENGYFGNTIQFRVTVELTKNGFIKKIKTSESQLLGTTYENLLKANENDVYSDAKYSSEFKFHYKGNKLKSIKYSAKSNDGIFSPAPLAMRNITEFIIKDDIHSRSVSWFTNSFAPVVAYKKADHLVRTMEQQILEQSSIGLNKLQLVGSESTPIVKLLRELKLGSVANQNKSQFVSDSKKMIIKALYAGELENILNLYITENKLDSSTKNNIESLNLSGVLENYLDSMYDRLINDNSSEAATMAAVLQMTNQDKQAITNNSNKFSEDLKPHIIIETSKKNPQFQIIYKVENHTDKIDFYKNFYYELISNNSELNTITVSVKSNRHTHNYRDISKNTATGSEEYQVVFKKTGTPQRTVIHSIKLKNDFFPTLNTEINSYKFKKLLENIGLSNMFLSKSDWFDFQSSDPMLFKPQNVIVGSVIENLFLGKADFKLNMLRPYIRPHPNTNLPKVHPATKNLSSKFKFSKII